MAREYKGLPLTTEGARMLLVWLAKRADRQIKRPGFIPALTSVLLEIAGFGFLTFGSFQLHSVAGWVVAAISCFVLAGKAQNKTTPATR